jgi:hypothetical protein
MMPTAMARAHCLLAARGVMTLLMNEGLSVRDMTPCSEKDHRSLKYELGKRQFDERVACPGHDLAADDTQKSAAARTSDLNSLTTKLAPRSCGDYISLACGKRNFAKHRDPCGVDPPRISARHHSAAGRLPN